MYRYQFSEHVRSKSRYRKPNIIQQSLGDIKHKKGWSMITNIWVKETLILIIFINLRNRNYLINHSCVYVKLNIVSMVPRGLIVHRNISMHTYIFHTLTFASRFVLISGNFVTRRLAYILLVAVIWSTRTYETLTVTALSVLLQMNYMTYILDIAQHLVWLDSVLQRQRYVVKYVLSYQS